MTIIAGVVYIAPNHPDRFHNPIKPIPTTVLGTANKAISATSKAPRQGDSARARQ
jgi:hypothetical protein